MIDAVMVLFSALVGFIFGGAFVCVLWARSLTRKRAAGRDVPPPDTVRGSDGRDWVRKGE